MPDDLVNPAVHGVFRSEGPLPDGMAGRHVAVLEIELVTLFVPGGGLNRRPGSSRLAGGFRCGSGRPGGRGRRDGFRFFHRRDFRLDRETHADLGIADGGEQAARRCRKHFPTGDRLVRLQFPLDELDGFVF